jgi:hypothetical protein
LAIDFRCDIWLQIIASWTNFIVSGGGSFSNGIFRRRLRRNNSVGLDFIVFALVRVIDRYFVHILWCFAPQQNRASLIFLFIRRETPSRQATGTMTASRLRQIFNTWVE